MRVKYPRTPHLPWSPGATRDDRVLTSTEHFAGKVVITEKMDGENCTIGRDYIHARSIDGPHHPSRDWVKGLQAKIGHNIPDGWRLCGENMYARHSIAYENLPSYFLLFSIWNGEECLSWDETLEWVDLLGLHTVPVLYLGVWEDAPLIIDDHSEGYVVRTADKFLFKDFQTNVAKFVRAGHVQTNTHWRTQVIIPNDLA